MKLAVNILLRNGKFVLIKNLLNFSSEDSSLSRDIISGSKSMLDLLLVDLHHLVHTSSRGNENALLKECSLHWPFLMDHYLFQGDNYQKKITAMLLNCLFLQEGRTLTAMAVQRGLCCAQ